jgi:hypothetical protein
MGLRRERTAPGETWRVRRLGFRISEARRLRGLIRDPDLQAVEMERHGRRTLAGLWFFLALGLTFTTEGVQRFLAGKATSADPLWWAAWTVEPMFAGLLIVLLNFEAVILAHGVEPGHVWWSRLKHVLLASTLAMNVIPQVIPLLRGRWDEFNLGSAAVHAIIPVIVYGIAEVIPVIQARQRQVILLAYHAADTTDTMTDTEEPVTEEPPTPEEPPAATEPRAAPQPRPVVTSAEVVRRAPKLPPAMAAVIKDAWTRAASEGREFTTADVRQAVKVPEALAEQIVTELKTNNGHAFT